MRTDVSTTSIDSGGILLSDKPSSWPLRMGGVRSDARPPYVQAHMTTFDPMVKGQTATRAVSLRALLDERRIRAA
jgi:hypothetical protein